MDTAATRWGRLRAWRSGILPAVGLVATFTLLAATLLPTFTQPHATSAYATGPRDGAELRRAILGGDLVQEDATRELSLRTQSLLTSPSYLDAVDAKGALYVALGLQEPYSEREAQALYRFVAERGGSALVAEDYNGDSVLARAFGASFTGAPILATESADPGRVGATASVGSARFTNLSLRTPVQVTISDDLPGRPVVTPLVETVGASAIDLNGDGKLDQSSDAPGPFIVGYRFTYESNGTLVLLGSASLFHADLWDASDNGDFAKALVPTLAPADATSLRVLFDEGRHHQAADPLLEPLEGVVALTRDGPLAAGLTLLAVLSAALLVLRVRGPEDWTHRYRGDRVVPMTRDPAGLRASLTRILEDQAGDGKDPKDLVQDAPTRAFLFDNHSPKPEELAHIAREVRRIVQ